MKNKKKNKNLHQRHRANRQKKNRPLLYGTYRDTGRGFGFVTPAEDSWCSEDIFVAKEDALGAFEGDSVAVLLNPSGGRGKAHGTVTRVLNRATASLVGTCFNSDRGIVFLPDDRRFASYSFVLDHQSELRIQERDEVDRGIKACVRITRYPKNHLVRTVVSLTEVLGAVGDKGIDVLSIIKSYGFHDKFSHEVLAECNRMPEKIPQEDYSGREDFRHYNIVTIDGDDSKDFDDAVYACKLENGNYMLQVHIADVAHYVNSMTLTDREAYYRGTSVYFLDRVLPMLPERLSNDLCSLRPDLDRLTMSVVMEVNTQGKVVDYRITEGVIRSAGRLTYSKVYKSLQGLCPEYDKYNLLLRDMAELAKILRDKRCRRGSLEFAFPEYKVLLDEDDKPISVEKVEITEANGIIEEFMILCNETVAEFVTNHKHPMIYRVHDNPDPEKLMRFAAFAGGLGYSMNVTSGNLQHELSRVIMNTEEDPRQQMIHSVMLRSLKKAEYSPDNIGHFGLASKCYCHFTSPIRRYPDLIVHRIIKSMMGKNSDPLFPDDSLHYAAGHLSDKERDAQDASREAEEIKKIEYMQNFIGQWFEGVICGINYSGLFVELDNGVEGFVELSSLHRFYEVDPDNFRIVSRGGNITLSMGNRVRVKVLSANINQRRVYFELDRRCEGK